MNKKKLIKYLFIILIPIYTIFGMGYLPSAIVYFTGIKYLFSPPEKGWGRIVYDNKFDFYSIGYSKKYKLHYTYFTQYKIGIRDENDMIPDEINGKMYEFEGKIKLEYFSENKLIKTDYITEWHRCGNSRKTKLYSHCELQYFMIPLENRYKDLSVKLTVIKPIKYDSKNNLSLYISSTQVYR